MPFRSKGRRQKAHDSEVESVESRNRKAKRDNEHLPDRYGLCVENRFDADLRKSGTFGSEE